MHDIMLGAKDMYDILIPIQYICLVVMLVEGWIVFRKSSTKAHLYFFFAIVVNFVNSAGYLFELNAHSAEAYLTALKLSYIGRVWVAFSLFLFITELCGVKVPTALKIGLAMFNIGVYLAVLTIRQNELFYKDVEFIYVDGYIRMMRSSGIVHKLQSVSLALYIVYILTLLIIKAVKEKNSRTKKCLVTVFIAMLVESAFTIVQVFVQTPITYIYDLTMPGFAIGTVIMLVAIFRFGLLGTEQLARDYMIDKLSEGIIAVDSSSKVRYFNEPAKKLYPDLKLSSGTVPSEITDAVASGGMITINDRIYKPGENELMQDGEKVGTLYALIDETEHFHYMEMLEEQKMLADSANKAKSSFLASMSHEIRTPINAVLGMDEMILRESSEKDIVGYAEDIQIAGRTLLSLINDILDFSKIEEGRMEIIPAQYELSSLINDLVNMVRSRADNKGLLFEVSVDGNIPHLLYGDEIRIKQCALNLLTNAVKYTEKGSVHFSVRYESAADDEILLIFGVKDTGIGMKPEDLEKLFSPFSRFEESRHRSIEGTGLGMSITKQLLGLMGSRLDVASVYGEGSEFTFAVKQKVIKPEPVGDYSARLVTESSHSAYREKFRAPDASILVVDDTPVNLSVIKGLLKRTLVKVETASSGKEALGLAQKKMYDLVFIDHMMPEMDGIETLHRLRELPGYGETTCVVLTANAVSGAREMYINEGFSDYLSKPVDSGRLENMLMSYLPPEKVAVVGDDDNDDEIPASEPETELPEKLFAISEIDTVSGLKHCGTPEVYMETLSVYESTVRSNSEEIGNFWNTGDIANATIKIHALKSTSRAIGADGLGALAERLETAGKANDTETLAAEIDGLIARYRALGEALSELFDTGGADEDKPLIPEDMLHKTYDAIKEYAENFDIDGAALAIDSLGKYRLPDSEKERYKQLKEAADNFDWDAVYEIAGN